MRVVSSSDITPDNGQIAYQGGLRYVANHGQIPLCRSCPRCNGYVGDRGNLINRYIALRAMNTTVLKLILRRIALKVGYRLWSLVSIIMFLILLGFVMYAIRDYECPVRRALGLPPSRSDNVATAFHPHPWEQNCEAPSVKP
jgi:hypothetical protein